MEILELFLLLWKSDNLPESPLPHLDNKGIVQSHPPVQERLMKGGAVSGTHKASVLRRA